jgi:hypothetical protein
MPTYNGLVVGWVFTKVIQKHVSFAITSPSILQHLTDLALDYSALLLANLRLLSFDAPNAVRICLGKDECRICVSAISASPPYFLEVSTQ